MEIESIVYNWYATTENGEERGTITVGKTYNELICKKIVEHLPMGEGDKLRYDVYFSDGSIDRIFNPNYVSIKPIAL
jgi:hypothetical protein